MASPKTFDELIKVKGVKLVHLNIRSIVKKIDQLRILVQDSDIDVFTVSETWLKPHLHTNIVELNGFRVFRLDRGISKKIVGGLLTFVNNKYSSQCESLMHLDKSVPDIEAQWVKIYRPHCKNIIICNIYRPPNGNLEKAISYLDDSLKTINLGKTNVFLLGDLNVNYKVKASPNYKKLHFFSQSNGLTQYTNNTTRNTDKSKSIIDLALSNSKFIDQAGSLEHYISDHQPIFLVHIKR